MGKIMPWMCKKLCCHIGIVCVTHYNDVMISAMASQITSLTTVYSTVYSGAYQRKHQSSTGLCAGNSLWTGEFPAQMASNMENVSIWWRHHVFESSQNRHLMALLEKVANCHKNVMVKAWWLTIIEIWRKLKLLILNYIISDYLWSYGDHSISTFIYLFIYLYIYLFIYLSIYSSIYLFDTYHQSSFSVFSKSLSPD